EGVAALIVACIAQAARDYDNGVRVANHPGRLIEENMWRALRYGLDGKLIDLDRAEERPAAAEVERLLQWTAPACAELGLEVVLPELNGSQRQRRLIDAGASVADIYAASVAETRATYSQSPVAETGRLR